MSEAARLPIPAALNGVLAAVAVTTAGGCLWAASHLAAPVAAAAALVFVAANNTIFCLLHECVHGTFHPSPRINDGVGRLLAAFLPTAFTIQRVSHFGHHRRNRTDLELYDCYLPHQSRWLKTYWIYCLLTGFYWSIVPVAVSVYLICPFVFRSRWFQAGPARLWGFEPFVRDIADEPIARVWPEVLLAFGVQAGLAWALDLSPLGWLACYAPFGVVWSTLQYTDHAGSPRDVREGAWNLRFPPAVQAVLLNYNLHLVHHRRPDIPWIHLPRFVRPEDQAPSFVSIYASLWRGAAPAPPGDGPTPLPRSAFPSRMAPP